MEHHGILRDIKTNQNIGKLGKYPCLLVELDRTGNPVHISLLSEETTVHLWRHSKGNHNSFPAIRLQNPLLPLEESEKVDSTAWKKANLSEKCSLLKQLDFTNINRDCRDIRITEWSLSELNPVLNGDLLELKALQQLINCFPREMNEKFHIALLNLIRKELESCDSNILIDFLRKMLIGAYDEKKKRYVAQCMTYFDVYETNEVPCKVISDETSKALITILNESTKNTKNSRTQTRRCALSGVDEELIDGKYPNPDLPQLGPTYLYSKKADTSCLERYGLIGMNAFQTSKESVSLIQNALAFLTSDEREGRSWSAMVDGNRDRPDLLLAYLTDDPQNDALLARILNNPADYEERAAAFDALCQQVLGNLKAVLSKNPSSIIGLIIIEPLDPGRKQIVYGNTFTAETFRNNLLLWSEASKNAPEISIQVLENGSIKRYHPICGGPGEICKLLKNHYSRSGSSKLQSQSTISIQDIYRLYMPRTRSDLTDLSLLTEALHKILIGTQMMLGEMGNQKNKRYPYEIICEKDKIRYACISISLISIILWRLNIRREDYMREAPFNVGQFLQLADLLHKEYCIWVRNGGDKDKELPKQLMGNDFLIIVSETPNEGLIRLRDRMRIYLAWASTVNGEGSEQAKQILTKYGEVCNKIADNEVPMTFDTSQQAQVLLGYLAKIP